MLFPTNNENALPVEQLNSLFEYSESTGLLVWKNRPDMKKDWNTRYAGRRAGTKRKSGYQVRIDVDGKGRLYWAHRIAWAIFHGEWAKTIIDHRDNDPDNNAIVNLRSADVSQNNCNRASVNGACVFKGVYYMKSKRRWAAQIKKNKKHTWLGLFNDAVEAAKAYDQAAIQQHGEYARTNASLGLL